ncbi:MAG TPA: glutamate racemase [Acidimicrobiia bacterium]
MATIGVFDSGVGGLSILDQIRVQHPSVHVIYLADQRHAPYGERTLAEVRARAVAVSTFLLGRGAEAIVVACNSASAAALHHLRARFSPVPFVGMEPAVKPAAANSSKRVVGVLATTATFQGELYASVVDRHAAGVQVIAVPAPGLAAAVEEGRDELAGDLLVRYLEPLLVAGIDKLVLGCTHYPFIAHLIAEVLGPDVELVDPSGAVARQLGRLVDTAGVGSGSVEYLTTGDAGRFGEQLRRLVAGGPEPGWVTIP